MILVNFDKQLRHSITVTVIKLHMAFRLVQEQCIELHRVGSYGRAAATKPHITKHNANCQIQWHKAHYHWTLEPWRRVLCAQSKAHKDMDE